jgi:hypothetical protein
MNAQDLHKAAARIETLANRYECLANKADAEAKPELAALHSAVARQLHDRAYQVRIWADQAELRGSVTPDMETGTAEFLTYAGCD